MLSCQSCHKHFLKAQKTAYIGIDDRTERASVILNSLRNEVIFRSSNLDLEEIVDPIKLRSWTWLHEKFKGFRYSFLEWTNCPFLCLKQWRIIFVFSVWQSDVWHFLFYPMELNTVPGIRRFTTLTQLVKSTKLDPLVVACHFDLLLLVWMLYRLR